MSLVVGSDGMSLCFGEDMNCHELRREFLQDGFSNLATVGGQSIVIIITGLATASQYQACSGPALLRTCPSPLMSTDTTHSPRFCASKFQIISKIYGFNFFRRVPFLGKRDHSNRPSTIAPVCPRTTITKVECVITTSHMLRNAPI